MKLSVIIPHFGPRAPDNVCLDRLRGGLGPDVELVVVTDRPGPETEGPVRYVRVPGIRGAGQARNRGAQAARGRALLFLDADVAPAPETLERLGALAAALPPRTILQGLYAEHVPHRGLPSQYKNLYYRYNYTVRRPAGALRTLSSHCFLIGRAEFLQLEGFDPRMPGATVEDSELGLRAVAAGFSIWLEPGLEVVHHKRYSLAGMLATDFRLCRDKTKLWLRHRGLLRRRPELLTVSGVSLGAMWAVALSVAAAPALWAAWAWRPPLAGALALALLAVNAPFCRYLGRRLGAAQGLAAAALCLLDYHSAFLGGIAGALQAACSRETSWT